MFGLIAFFAVLLVSVASDDSRIVNGEDAKEGEFPFAVSLRHRNRHTCGGTIINEKYILTAAHCVCNNKKPLQAKYYSVQYGSIKISQNRDRTIDVKKIICNDFNREKLTNDLAVLELEQSLPSDNSWKPVKIAAKFDQSNEHHGVIIGWGRISHGGPLSEVLQKLNVTTFAHEVCNQNINAPTTICFGSSEGGACNGDSGTALLVRGEQVGIASFLVARCGVANETYPNYYTNVPEFHDWIKKQSQLDEETEE